jgi:hypothetical protein
MAWQRQNKKWYYYHTIRQGNKFVNLYCGSGERGAAFERFFAGLRAARRAGRAERPDPTVPGNPIGPTDGPRPSDPTT